MKINPKNIAYFIFIYWKAMYVLLCIYYIYISLLYVNQRCYAGFLRFLSGKGVHADPIDVLMVLDKTDEPLS